jgi:hypothetical protein
MSKNIRRILLLSYCLFLVVGVFAQTNPLLRSNKKNTIFIAPLNVFDVVNPSIQLGYERFLSNQISIQGELGIIMHHSITNFIIDKVNGVNDCQFNSSGFKARAEVKYFYKKKSYYNPYISAELYYMRNVSRTRDLFEVSDSLFQYPYEIPVEFNQYYDFYTLDKQKIGLNMKIGWKFLIMYRFEVEPYLGLGIAYRNSKHENRINPLDKEFFDDYFNDSRQGVSWFLNIPFNVKLGYRF